MSRVSSSSSSSSFSFACAFHISPFCAFLALSSPAYRAGCICGSETEQISALSQDKQQRPAITGRKSADVGFLIRSCENSTPQFSAASSESANEEWNSQSRTIIPDWHFHVLSVRSRRHTESAITLDSNVFLFFPTHNRAGAQDKSSPYTHTQSSTGRASSFWLSCRE
jgi:hypothetical protein